jgi:iron(III) transport system substrate-binding protein
VDLSAITLVEYDAVKAGAAKTALNRRFDGEVAQAPKS